MDAVRPLELRVGRGPEERLDVHDGPFLLADEVSYGERVLVAPMRMAHLKGRVRAGTLLVEGGRRDSDPSGIRQRGGHPAHRLQVSRRLFEANLGLVRRWPDAGGVIATQKADDPIRPLRDEENKASQRHGASLG